MQPSSRRQAIRLEIACAIAFSAVLVFADTVQAQTWVRTVEGCTIYDQLREFVALSGVPQTKMDPSDVKVTSTIPCRDGKLDGEGIVKYFYRGHQYWEWQISEERGIRAVEGVLRPVIDETRLKVKGTSCKFQAILHLVAPPNLAYEMPQIWTELRSIGKRMWARACQRPDLAASVDLHDFRIYSDGSPNRNPAIAKNRLPPNWIQNTAPGDRIRSEVDTYRLYWRQREQQAVDAERVALQQEQARRASQERMTRRQQLAKETGAFPVVVLSEIAPNPFVWKGKLIGTCVRFERMYNETTAWIQGGADALLTGVPTARFPRPIVVFLVARVTGQMSGVTSLLYVAAVDQPRGGHCSEFIDP